MNPKYYNLYNNYIYVCERKRERTKARKDHPTAEASRERESRNEPTFKRKKQNKQKTSSYNNGCEQRKP